MKKNVQKSSFLLNLVPLFFLAESGILPCMEPNLFRSISIIRIMRMAGSLFLFTGIKN